MVTVAQVIETMIKQKPFIESAISEGLINLSAYSRLIKPDVEKVLKKDVTEAAILMALKRLVPHLEVSMHKKIEKATKGFGDIIVRSHLCDFTYKNTDSLIDCQNVLIKQLANEKEIFYTISRGVFETTIVINAQFSDEVNQIFGREQLLASSFSISSVTLRLPKDNIKIPGLYYHIFKQIAWEGISVLEAISTTNELSIVIKDKDVDKAFAILKQSYK